MIPDGWQWRTVGECARFTSGSTPSKAVDAYWGGSWPWLTARDMKSLNVNHTSLSLTDEGLRVASVVPRGAVFVLTRGMTLMKDLPVCLAERDMGFNQDIKALLPKAGIDSAFLAYQIIANKHEILNLVDTAGHGTGRLDTGLLDSFSLHIPPLPEQRKIAEALRTWGSAVRVTERLLDGARGQVRGLLTKLLRLPVGADGPDVDSGRSAYPPSVQPGVPTLPSTPHGWRRVSLGSHLTENRRPVRLQDGDEYRLVTVRRSRGGVALRSVLRGAEVKTPSQFYVRAGDFLISKRQIVHGACGIVPPELDGAVVSNEYAVLNSDGELDLQFLRYLSESLYFQQTCFHSSIGVHVEKMIFKTERWLTWPFNLPPLAEQRHIVEILDCASAEISNLERQVESLRQEKRALMGQLLSGKRRLPLTAQPAETTA